MALQTAMYTSNPVHVHEFVWTVNNFSRTPNTFHGPSFSPIPGSSTKFCFELQVRFASGYCIMYLNHLDNQLPDLNMSSDITLLLSDHKIWQQLSTTVQNIKASNPLINFIFDENKKLEILNILEDKLIVKGKLSYSGYTVISNISKTVENSSEELGELLKNLKTMYENGYGYDITFSVDSKQLRAHKTILSSRSKVFSKMFLHDMKEKNSGSVVIQDINFHIFNCFLVFLYTGVVEDKNWNTVIDLYSAADKYQVDSLRKACSRILCNSLTIDSACPVLVFSDLHNDEELKEAGKLFILENFSLVVKSSEWDAIIDTKPKLASEVLARFKSMPFV